MPLTHHDHLINFESIKMAKQAIQGTWAPPVKRAFVPASDPSAGGGGAPPPGGGGGAPPPPGGDPSGGMGGAPPMDPSMMGGGGGGDPSGGGSGALDQILQKLNQLQAFSGGAGGGGGGAGGGGALKPKIDINVVMLQVLKLLAKICDTMGIQVPASEMVPDMQGLGQLASASQGQGAMAGQGGGGQPAIPPVDPMQALQGAGMPAPGGAAPPGGGGAEKTSSYYNFDTSGFVETQGRMQAVRDVLKRRRSA